ncbi:MAG: hypothetical protein GX673_10595 [Gammaproteobacteria bacterium]|nr:hypothetical protein [Gammaproteobacteria bacterium]
MSKKSDFTIKNDQFIFREQPYLLTSRVTDGILAFPAKLILQHQQVKTKIMLIRGLCPLQASDFEHLIMPVIHSVVRHMHLLPATEAHHHREMMGLLTHSLDVAHGALVGAKSQEWDDGFAECWQVAAMLAGLLSDIGVPYENILVQRGSDGEQWDRTESLADWLSAGVTTDYSLSWVVGRAVTHKELKLSVQLAQQIISPELQSFLAPVWKGFCIAIDEQKTRNRNTLQKILNQANTKSVAYNIAASCDAELIYGSTPPIWFNYLSAIVALVHTGNLTVNQSDSTVFITENFGVMLDLYNISELNNERPFPAQYSQQLRSSSRVRQALADSDKLIRWQKQSGELMDYWSVNLRLEAEGESVTVKRKLIRLSTAAQKIFEHTIPEIIRTNTVLASVAN